MQLCRIIGAGDSQVFPTKLNLSRGLIRLIERIVHIPVGNGGLADFLVADEDDLPLIVGSLLVFLI